MPQTHLRQARIRVTPPLVTHDEADRIKLAAQIEGRSVSNLVSRAACLYANHVLSAAGLIAPTEDVPRPE